MGDTDGDKHTPTCAFYTVAFRVQLSLVVSVISKKKKSRKNDGPSSMRFIHESRRKIATSKHMSV
jgi:hypothetical protein